MFNNIYEDNENNEHDMSLIMTCEEEHKILTEEEILSLSKCAKLSDVRKLNVAGKCFTLICSEDLSRCINLSELDLSKNLLKYFPRNLNLQNIRFLDISGNPFVENPLIEQFPNLLILNVDHQMILNMDREPVYHFCPNLKIINNQTFNKPVNDEFLSCFSNTIECIESIIQSKCDLEFPERFKSVSDLFQRQTLINEVVKQIRDNYSLGDKYLERYGGLLIYKLTREYIESKLPLKDDELPGNDETDQLLLMRFGYHRIEEMEELQKPNDDLIGESLESIAMQILLETYGEDGQPVQTLVEQQPYDLHIGESLSQHESVVMSSRDRKFIKYKKAAKAPPQTRINPFSNSDNKPIPVFEKKVVKSLVTPQKRLRVPIQKNIIKRPKIVKEIPRRVKRHRKNREMRSLEDLPESSRHYIDYVPFHFIRCHCKDTLPIDQETKIWRCAFEPNQNKPGLSTHIVATCGGNIVCLIDCTVGKVIKRFKKEREEFMSLAWTTLKSGTGQTINILAAGGKSKEIRLIFISDEFYIDMTGHQDDVSALTFNSSSPQILFSGDTKASVFVWDINAPTLLRYQLVMKLKCPDEDLNPVMNLLFLDHHQYLLAGCDDGIFAWKFADFQNEKLERELDMELLLTEINKIDYPLIRMVD